jgi:hypothetical protein
MHWQDRAEDAFQRFDVVAPATPADMQTIAAALREAVPGAQVEVYHTYTHIHARVDHAGAMWLRTKEIT